MQLLKSFAALSLVFGIAVMIGCGGSDGPADVSPDTPPATDDGSNGDVAHDDAAQG